MNIFTQEYAALIVYMLIAIFHVIKKPRTNERSGESSVDNYKTKQLQ